MIKPLIFSVALLLFVSVSASADVCGIYSYQDVLDDGAGNLIGEILTQANCLESTAYAEVHLTMPSGAQSSASSTGSTSAEALADLSGINEEGHGRLFGYSEAYSSCFDGSAYIGQDVDIMIGPAYTKLIWIGGQIGGTCATTSNCSNTATPMCTSAGVMVGPNGSCSPGWNAVYFTYKVGLAPRRCGFIFSVPTQSTSPGECTLPY